VGVAGVPLDEVGSVTCNRRIGHGGGSRLTLPVSVAIQINPQWSAVAPA